MIELRKRRIEDSMDQGAETPALYQVLPEKRTAVGGAMMGSAHIYDVPPVSYMARPMSGRPTTSRMIYCIWPGLQIRVPTGKLFFLFLNQNICCWYSKESSQ